MTFWRAQAPRPVPGIGFPKNCETAESNINYGLKGLLVQPYQIVRVFWPEISG